MRGGHVRGVPYLGGGTRYEPDDLGGGRRDDNPFLGGGIYEPLELGGRKRRTMRGGYRGRTGLALPLGGT